MKKRILSAFLVAIITMLNACTPAYVHTVPSRYQGNIRPPSPSNTHIWIDGNWIYNRQTKSYQERNGYWSKPSRRRSYQTGYWKKSQRGNQWVRGQWR